MSEPNQIEIYQTEDGSSEVEVRFNHDSAWLSIQQMSELFDRDKSVISRHLKNIFESGELVRNVTVAKNATVQIEGKRKVNREIEFFNLDAIISVGYRVNSKKGTQFRIWATQRLKELLIHGYALNQQRFEKNAKELQQALKLIEKTAKSPELTLDARGLTEIVSRYTQAFLWLQQYDEGLLDEPEGSIGGKLISSEKAQQLLNELKKTFVRKIEPGIGSFDPEVFRYQCKG